MLIVRIATILAIAPIAIVMTVWLPTFWFAFFFAQVLLLGLREWIRLIGISSKLFIPSACCLTLSMYIVYPYGYILYVITVIGAVYWFIQLVNLYTGRFINLILPYGLMHGFIILLAVWSSLVLLHQTLTDGTLMVVALLGGVWSADMFAYFTGKSFGRKLLAPSISPCKTIEGVIGGGIGAVVFSIMIALVMLSLSETLIFFWAVFTFISALMGVVGDLYESRIKRHAGVKDSGTLLPGHGGVLDRIDGLLAAAPVFVALWWLVL